MNNDNTMELPAWEKRPWILALLMAGVGVLVHLIIGDSSTAEPWQYALTGFVVTTGTALAYSLEQKRVYWSVTFSVVWGLILASLIWWVSDLDKAGFDYWWPIYPGVLSALIALPLFQTARLHGKMEFDYHQLHAFAWTNVVSWFAAWAFVGVVFLLAYLLSSLFQLIGIEVLRDLLKDKWFTRPLTGISFGAALGILKENQQILAGLQRLVMSIFSVLAPCMAVALALFLVSLPFTGLAPLWNATDDTTPILLSCAAGAVLLVNAVIRNSDQDMPNSRILQLATPILNVCVLPLAVIAWVSMQQRISQYGLTPDRIWGLLSVLVASAYGTAYLVATVKQRLQAPALLRRLNTKLAMGLCLVLLLLATPLANFGTWSANSQIQRLQSGELSADQFDYASFAFKFGHAGREYLQQLENSDNPEIAEAAALALQADSYFTARDDIKDDRSRRLTPNKLQVVPEAVSPSEEMYSRIVELNVCVDGACTLHWNEDEGSALLIGEKCSDWRYPSNSYQHCPPTIYYLDQQPDQTWRAELSTRGRSIIRRAENSKYSSAEARVEKQKIRAALEQGNLEIREVTRRQLFIDGEPVGEAFD